MRNAERRHEDATLIDGLGGPAKVAEMLHYDKAAGGVQRVQNWLKRGIPAAVKVKHPKLFMVDMPLNVAQSDVHAVGMPQDERVQYESLLLGVGRRAEPRDHPTDHRETTRRISERHSRKEDC